MDAKQATDIQPEDGEIAYVYRYGMDQDSRDKRQATLSIAPNNYDKRLSAILKLRDKLLAAIPFFYTQVGESEIHVINDERRRGFACVTVSIQYDIAGEEAAAQLEAKGFSRGLFDIFA